MWKKNVNVTADAAISAIVKLNIKINIMTAKALKKISTNKQIKAKLLELYDEVFVHDGYGEIKVDMRILSRGQKEIIIYCGKQYRFVVDFVKS